jgi:alpha-amylase
MEDQGRKPTGQNATLFQGFEWNVPADGKHWKRLLEALPKLKAIGIDNIWLPPGCKASSSNGNGYDIYDLYDLGEFNQKGSRATKWGTKEELMELAKLAKESGVGLYWDAVLNHKAAADNTEKCKVVEVDLNDRTKEISEPYEIEGWLGFDFPGRGDKYSSQKYHWYHFSGTDFNAENNKRAIYKILGDNKGWSSSVDNEQGNADYMMFADLDYSHPEV